MTGGKLDGRRIVVTGAASGMGRAIAELFVKEGAAVTVLDRDKERVEAVADAIGGHGFDCDVSQRREVADVIARADAALGGIDGIVNAAGILEMAQFDELSPESWDRMLAVNLTGPFNIVHAALPMLRAAASGTIVNIASTASLQPTPGSAGYGASKAGLLMFTRCLGFDLGPTIRANAICPGTIRTEMTRYLWDNPENLARVSDRVALKRVGEVEEVARMALFLTGPDSAFTTGAALVMDGGHAWQ